MVKTLVVMQRCVSDGGDICNDAERWNQDSEEVGCERDANLWQWEFSCRWEVDGEDGWEETERSWLLANTADKGVCTLVAGDLSVAGCKALREYKDVWLAGDEAHDKSVCLWEWGVEDFGVTAQNNRIYMYNI